MQVFLTEHANYWTERMQIHFSEVCGFTQHLRKAGLNYMQTYFKHEH